jgi:hypothetical protein
VCLFGLEIGSSRRERYGWRCRLYGGPLRQSHLPYSPIRERNLGRCTTQGRNHYTVAPSLVYGLGLDRSCPNRSLSPPLRLLYYLFPHSPLHLSRPTNTTTGLHPGLLSHFQAFNVSRIRVRYCGILGPSISGRSVRVPSYPSELSDKVSESGDIRAPMPLRSIPPGHPTALLTKSHHC